MNKQEELLELLVQNNLLRREQITEIMAAATSLQTSAEHVLLKRSLIDPEELAKIKAKQLNFPYESLLDKKILGPVLNIIPEEVCQNYKIICFDKQDKKIKVGIMNPDDFKAIEAVDFLSKKEGFFVEYYLISDLSFNFAFKQYKTLKEEVSTALETKAKEEENEPTKKKSDEGDLDYVIKSAPVAKIVSVIIRHAVDGRASDIHIEPLSKESRVRYRIDGVLRTSLILPKDIHGAVVARIKVLSNLKLDETRIPQDGRIRMLVNDKEIDLRISILPVIEEEKVVMRILDTTKGAPEMEDLGYQGKALDIIKNNINKTEGMFLVTGPTGSGKSTTLFSVLNKLNKEGINISTLEDPIEYYIKGVNQSQVKPEVGFSFASGLRSLLRQDPDIIMVGEIRDGETAELAIHASLTGHFVLSTLHTNDAAGAIPRLLDMNVEAFLLGSTLNTVVAQRLARKICGFCKEEAVLPAEIMDDIKKEMQSMPKVALDQLLPNLDINTNKFYASKGCPRCANTGYTGRLALNEVIDVNSEIKDLIIESGKTKTLKLEEALKNQNFITMRQDGIIKVLQGKTTMEEIMRVLYD